jgi:hypothetical protein
VTLRTLPVAGAAGLMLMACARASAPPGGPEMRDPPAVVETVPGHLALVEPGTAPAIFRFGVPLSERGISDQLALVSPATGDVAVRRRGSDIHVSVRGGWQPDVVYRIVLLPGVRDRFGNERREPLELVFSTGPEITEGAIAGLVNDRITGRAAANALVEATRRQDSLTYVTAVDSAGFFGLRYLRAGSYEIRAWVDQNGNRRRDPQEPFARARVITLNRDTDTTTIVLDIVPADTTPARVTRAEYRDSLQVRITTDDYLDPDFPLGDIQVRLYVLPDSTAVPGAHRVLHPSDWDRDQREARAAADTTAPPRAVSPVRPEPQRLPQRELVLVPAVALQPETRYVVTLTGLANVTGLPGGGGSATFEVPERAVPSDTVRTDTLPPGPRAGRRVPAAATTPAALRGPFQRADR